MRKPKKRRDKRYNPTLAECKEFLDKVRDAYDKLAAGMAAMSSKEQALAKWTKYPDHAPGVSGTYLLTWLNDIDDEACLMVSKFHVLRGTFDVEDDDPDLKIVAWMRTPAPYVDKAAKKKATPAATAPDYWSEL